jgi:hypothetical protein
MASPRSDFVALYPHNIGQAGASQTTGRRSHGSICWTKQAVNSAAQLAHLMMDLSLSLERQSNLSKTTKKLHRRSFA